MIQIFGKAKCFDTKKEYEDCYLPYLAVETDIDEKILENQQILKTPIVRNGNKATVGVCPEIWKLWQ